MKTFQLLATILVLGQFLPSNIRAEETKQDPKQFEQLDKAMAGIAKDVALYLKGKPNSNNACVVGKFDGGSGRGGGAEIARKLREHLGKETIKLGDPGTPGYSVVGDFETTRSENGREFVIDIETKVKGPGARAYTFESQIKMDTVADRAELIALFGLTVDLSEEKKAGTDASVPAPPITTTDGKNAEAAGERKAGDRLEEAFTKPKVSVDEKTLSEQKHITVARFSEGSPYGMDILLKQKDGSYAPVPILPDSEQKGAARVKFDAEEIFAVRLHNDSNRPVGVILTLDGINVFHMATVPGWKELGKMAIGPNRAAMIHGWTETDKISREFKVTEYGTSLAAKLGVEEGVNSITAVFVTFNPGSKGVDPVAIGIGERVKSEFSTAHGSFGEILGAVTIRYSQKNAPTDLPAGLPK